MKREPINIPKLPDYDKCVEEHAAITSRQVGYLRLPGPSRKRKPGKIEQKFLHRRMQRGRNL